MHIFFAKTHQPLKLIVFVENSSETFLRNGNNLMSRYLGQQYLHTCNTCMMSVYYLGHETKEALYRLLVKFLIKQKTLVLRTAFLFRSSTIVPYSPPTVASVKQSIVKTQLPSFGRTATDRYFHYSLICQKTFSIKTNCYCLLLID